MSFITIDGLKTALIEMKNHITSKFYTKEETDNNLNQFKININQTVSDALDSAVTTTIPNKVDELVNTKLTDFETHVDSELQSMVDAKQLDTSNLVTKEELDITKVITSDNFTTKNIASIADLPTVLNDTDFNAMITDLTSEGGVY